MNNKNFLPSLDDFEEAKPKQKRPAAQQQRKRKKKTAAVNQNNPEKPKRKMSRRKATLRARFSHIEDDEVFDKVYETAKYMSNMSLKDAMATFLPERTLTGEEDDED